MTYVQPTYEEMIAPYQFKGNLTGMTPKERITHYERMISHITKACPREDYNYWDCRRACWMARQMIVRYHTKIVGLRLKHKLFDIQL